MRARAPQKQPEGGRTGVVGRNAPPQTPAAGRNEARAPLCAGERFGGSNRVEIDGGGGGPRVGQPLSVTQGLPQGHALGRRLRRRLERRRHPPRALPPLSARVPPRELQGEQAVP